MREIKFRAWHKPTQLMDDVVLIDFYNEQIGILYADPVMQCESIQRYNFSEVEIMQYTGLNDKNGKEIYEGDIVNLKYPRDKRYKVVAKVVNGQEISAMVLKFDNDFTTEEFPLYKISAENNLEVIGSVHDNPELVVD